MGIIEHDFSGWATRNDVKCSDGRTIRKNAFKDDDYQIVPLIWQHDHNSPMSVLGHAMLENRPEGVYAYGKFNNTEAGLQAKELVECGDVTSLSIFANGLRESSAGDVVHGRIREVSIVLSGANPEAKIDRPTIIHSTDAIGIEYYDLEEDEAVIYSGIDIILDEDEIEHADTKKEEPKVAEKEKTIGEVFETLTDEQKDAVYAVIAMAIDESKNEGKDEKSDTVKHYDEGDEYDMKYNAFEQDTNNENTTYLSHAEQGEIIGLAKKSKASLKDTFLEHGYPENAYGIMARDENTYGIDMLFPEYKNLNNPPEWIKRDTDWVTKVMSGIHHTPFSRIKSSFADIRDDEARAKGYLKGNRKKEEVFTLLKRTTDPQTIYKKQKLDRDDVIDITDFDVVAWIKSEMRLMLDEEIARAILVGDGRQTDSDDHISHSHVRPIWLDDELFTIRKTVPDESGSGDVSVIADATIETAIRARKEYKGSGNPTFYTTADVLTDMLLLKDGMGRRMYNTTAELATALRVSSIVEVPIMENLTRTVGEGAGAKTYELRGIIVNLADYNVGADKGGAINLFDDFDIDYNQMKYLIETRISGALTKPFSAIALELDVTEAG